MNALHKVLRISAYGILSFLVFVVLYLIGAYSLSRIPVGGNDNSEGEIAIYIKSNGVHTDIVMPVKSELIDWSDKIELSHIDSKGEDFQYIGMGWGDKGFYLETPTWGDLTFSTAFVATFALGSTAIHCTYNEEVVEGEKCVQINISKEEYAALIDYINSSFQKNELGRYMNIETNANYGSTDAFYEANGTYHLFHTCNTWSNNALKACDQKASLWTPFDAGLFKIYAKE